MSKLKLCCNLRRTHLVPATCTRNLRTIKPNDARLFLTVNEYRPLVNPEEGITLILTHGTSFCKELWEPLIEFWLNEDSPLSIAVIYTFDAVNHGDSAVVNRQHLTTLTHWPDHSNDIITVLDYFRVSGHVVGIGHSFGGGTLAHASVMYPNRFAAIILVEPIIFEMKVQTAAIAKQAMRRRDSWTSLDDVHISLSKSKGFADWTPDQRERYAIFATYNAVGESQHSRILKTPKEQESATYLAGPHPEVIEQLWRSQRAQYYVVGEKSEVLNKDCQQVIKGLAEVHGGLTVMSGAGHLIPMTHPVQLAVLLEKVIIKSTSDVSHIMSSI